MRYCIHCKQSVQPKKKFRIGLFIGLFFLGIVLVLIFGFMAGLMSSPMIFVPAGATYADVQLITSLISGFGVFLFFLCWVPYLIHYGLQTPCICPICGGRDFESTSSRTHTYSIAGKIVILIAIALTISVGIQLILPFPYGLGAALVLVVGMPVCWLKFRKPKPK